MVIGDQYIKVKSLKDDRGNHLKEAFPSYAVQIVPI